MRPLSFYSNPLVLILLTLASVTVLALPGTSRAKSLQKTSEAKAKTPGQTQRPENEDTAERSFDHQHSAWSKVLSEVVVMKGAASQVRYKALKQDPSQLQAYLDHLSEVSPEQFESWSEKQQLAFLINAYNAFTLKLIIMNYPIKSIKDIGGFFSSPWKKRFFTLLGKKQHLDHIEHGILRKNYKEPRIHFAVNCASVGCPALLSEAFVPDQLEAQLDKQTRLFLQDKSRNRIAGDRVYLSKIFDWFEEDFVKHSGSVQAFVAPYITDDPKLKKLLEKDQLSLRHTSYDWGLNGVP